jgi:hypothetical protein
MSVQDHLTSAHAAIVSLQAQQSEVGTSMANAEKAKTLSAAQSSIKTGITRLQATETTTASILADIQAALAVDTPPPSPIPPGPTITVQPTEAP